MLEDEEDEACATDCIVDVGTGEAVGLLYTWEDGTKQPYWFDGEKSDVVVTCLSKLEL